MRNIKYHYPKAIAKQYTSFVLRYTDQLIEEIQKELDVYLESFDNYRVDQKDVFESLWVKLASLIDKAFDNPIFVAGIDRAGEAVSVWNDEGYSDKIFQLIGFNEIPLARRTGLLDNWSIRNLNLIKDVSRENVKALQQLFYTASSDGTSHKEIQLAIRKIIKGNDARYKLITDDQVGKLNADLDRIKQQQQGLIKYRWESVGDLAVRKKHEARHGKIFEWDNPPDDGHPGKPVRCRCRASVVLDEIFGKEFVDMYDLEAKDAQADWLKKENERAA